MSNFLFSAAFGGLMMSGVAVAADVNRAPAPAFNWSGAYAGLEFGADMHSSNWSSPTNAFVTFNTNGTGLAGGGVIGYRQQKNNFVFGLEGSADILGVDGEANCVLVIPACVTKASFLGMVQGNIGVAVNRAHFYGSGGVAFGNFEHYDKISFNQTWGMESRVGWTVGAGVDYALNDHLIGGVRWNYYDFGTKTINAPFPVSFTENGNLITARLEYKF